MDNLDRDSARALALGYGVHYGHYKVDYPNTMDPVETEPVETRGRCMECQELFVPGKSTQKFCSEECRRAYGQKRKHTRVAGAPCRVCGKPVTDRWRRAFCSNDCMMEANRRRVRERERCRRQKEASKNEALGK